MKPLRAIVIAALGLVVPACVLAADDSGAERGHDVFQKWCAPCHAPGPDHPGTDALAAKYNGEKPAALEERTDLSANDVRNFVRHGVSIMPFFRKTEIPDADLDALAAYLARGK